MSLSPKRKAGPPNADAVQKRAMILRELSLRAIILPPREPLAKHLVKWTEQERLDFVRKVRDQFAPRIRQIQEIGLWDEMEEAERKFMEMSVLDISERQLVDASWLSESAACLLWALEYIAQLPPYDTRVEAESMKVNFRKDPSLCRLEIIKRQRDIAKLWHWRARTRQLKEMGEPEEVAPGMTIDRVLQITSGKAAEDGIFPAPIENDFPAFNKAYRDLSDEEYSLANSIALERHRAVNWLCGLAPENCWSKTPTDT
jgi:hypothetical protein